MSDTTTTRLGERYGAGAAPASDAVAWNDTIDLLARHRSVRRFDDRPVSDAELNALIVAAQSAASSSNLQVVSVIAVRDRAIIDALADIATQEHVRTAPVVLVWLVDHSRLQRIAHGEPGAVGQGTQDAQAASSVDFSDYTNSLISGVFDAGLSAQNAVVAAESLGLGTVYLGSLRNDVPAVAELLHLPKYVFPVVGLSVGWPSQDEHAGVKPRLPLEAVLHQERFDDSGIEAQVETYEAISAAYYDDHGLDVSWIDRVRNRVSDGSPERNRAIVAPWLREQGFGLR